MLLILKSNGVTHTLEIDDNASIDEFVEACAKLAESNGYMPSSIASACKTIAEFRE